MTEVALHPLIVRAAEGHLPEWAEAGQARREHMARVAAVLGGWARTLELDAADEVRWRALGYLHDVLRDADPGELRRLLESGGDVGDSGRGDTDRSDSGRGDSDRDSGQGDTGRRDTGRRDSGRGDSDRGAGVAWSVDWGAFASSPGAAVSGVEEKGGQTVQGGILHGPAAALTLAREGVEDVALLSAIAYHTVGHPELAPCGRALYCADFLEPGRSTDPEMRARLRERFPDDPDGVLQDVLRSRVGYLLERGRPIFFGTVGIWNRLTR